MVGVTDLANDTDDELRLFVTKIEYTEEGSRPITHLFGRDEDGERRWISVAGHRPSFYVDASVPIDDFTNHYAYHDHETDAKESLHGTPLTKVETKLPKHVSELRDHFPQTYEADVLYPRRWQIDTGVKTGVSIDTSQQLDRDTQAEMRVPYSAVEPCSLDETPTPDARICTIDIEVGSEDGFPDPESADWPVTTIVAHDSYTDEYTGWLLMHGRHGSDVTDTAQLAETAECDDVRVFDSEKQLLHDFNEYIEQLRPDIFSGWFCADFDYPYLINRCRALDVWSYKAWSPLGDVYDGRYDPTIKGSAIVDGIAAYRKTQIHTLTSEKLDAIAQDELGVGKLDVDTSHTEMWKAQPAEFLRYNKVDVERTHQIAASAGSIALLENLRAIAGGSYTDFLGGNIDMMDMVFLRKAHERGIALPTAEPPDVGDYHGAYVYTPEAGVHTHVVYPDYSSLYPNMMYQCNISPETLVGTDADLAESDYTEDDCVWTYIDTTTAPAEKSDVEASDDRMERLYFLSPDEQVGFVRDVLDDIMGLADEYTGGMYAAAKRVRNSTYGVLGDSDSYGRGFRLFDWRLAEGTTLGGQKVLKEGGRVFADYVDDPDARVVYGDTDSVVTTFPNADDAEAVLEQSFAAAEQVNEHLDGYCQETFGLSAGDSRMELEIESYARGIFFKGKDNGKSADGVKKRYAQLVEWDDDDGWIADPSVDITGFEYVRSDVAQVTKDVQYKLFETILQADDQMAARERFYDWLRDTIHAIMERDYDMNDVGIPFGMGQSLDEYGSADRRPQPKYRGAKYAAEYIYGSANAIGEGDRPLEFRVDTVTGDQRKTFDAETREHGDSVDCVSVFDYDDIPPEIHVDVRTMVDKTIVDPIEAIINTLDWPMDEIDAMVESATPAEYYRDADQTGLDASNFM